MEMWIFLAAAGSGYLAKCWQDFYKNRDTDSHSHTHVNKNGDSRLRNKGSRDKGKWAICTRTSKCSNPHNADADASNTSNQVEDGANSSSIVGSSERENNSNANSRKHHTARDMCLENPGKSESGRVEEPVMVVDRDGETRSQQQNNYVQNIDMLANDYLGEYGFGDESVTHEERGSLDGRRRRRRKRALWAAKANRPPLNSFDSCLIAHINGDINEFDTVFSTSFLTSSPAGSQRHRHLVVTDGTGIVSREGIDPLLLPLPFPYPTGDCQNINKSKEDASAIGLPCLPPKTNGTINIQSKTSHSLKNAGLMTLKRRRMSKHDPPTISWSEFQRHFTYQDTSAGFILFSFGVGIGIMSTIMSSRKEIERLTFLLRETEELVEDLEEELEMRASWTVKDVSGEVPVCSDACRNDAFPVGLSNEVAKVDETIYDEDRVKERETMTSVEAELEAELEKLEVNFHTSKHHRNVSGLSEIDPDCIADVITGELKVDGLIHNAESVEDESASTNEEFNKGNFAVSPRDLERRLHEVIETRLQERIIQLESELEASKRKLWAIELGQQQTKALNHKLSINSEFEVLNTTSNYLENEIGLQAHKVNSSKVYSNLLVNQKKNDQFISKELLGGFGNGMPDGCYSGSQRVDLTRADCGEFDMQNIDEVVSIEHETPPLFLSLSGDALSTYNEVYDEFMEMILEKGTSALDSTPVKDEKLSKESVLSDNYDSDRDDAQEDGKHILHAEPFPLPSTTCWNVRDLGSSGSQASCSSIELQSLSRTDLEFEGIGP